MSKYIYAVAIMRTDNDKLFAEALRISSNKNLASVIRGTINLQTLNIMPNKSKAIETARTWEDTFIANGTAYFDKNYVANCYDL